MRFKRNLEEAVGRNREFWTGQASGRVLAKIEVEGNSVLDMWVDALSPEIIPDPVRMFRRFLQNFRNRESLLDDSIPTARPSYGSSAYGAFFGADVHYGASGAYSRPILTHIRDYRRLSYSFETGWLKQQIEATRHFAEQAEGLCGVCIIETMDNLNLAENLVGSKIYLDLVDNPREILDFFDFALEFNTRLIREQRKHIGKYEGGYFDIHEIWVPGDTIWLSIDAWNLVSPQMFRLLGLRHIQAIIDAFGGAWLHMHNQGLHLLEEVMRLEHLVGIGILDDPTEPRCFPRLRKIQEITKGMPLQINCSRQELESGIREKSLPRNVMYWVDRGVRSADEANRIMKLVLDY
jgi:hypothetical protein